jgi:hypothetical protein
VPAVALFGGLKGTVGATCFYWGRMLGTTLDTSGFVFIKLYYGFNYQSNANRLNKARSYAPSCIVAFLGIWIE